MGVIEDPSFEYTQQDYASWKKEVLFDKKSITGGKRVIMNLLGLMMDASIRPGVEKSYVVFHALIQAIEQVKKDFQMEKHIEAELRDRQATETKFYTVGELRKNDLLAK